MHLKRYSFLNRFTDFVEHTTVTARQANQDQGPLPVAFGVLIYL